MTGHMRSDNQTNIPRRNPGEAYDRELTYAWITNTGNHLVAVVFSKEKYAPAYIPYWPQSWKNYLKHQRPRDEFRFSCDKHPIESSGHTRSKSILT